ncbi:MAG: UDP-4-amino-4,6-dideoxy-N-acetyl-beta-L-altrosamine transaminase [Candidatus Omnitrophica bacterium]|nr:UDP-4-amino-4,6-dideoxy-N-acetyl-beta-L-altrosamine transaminase [Candidatus Omnitrophota bacterium]MDD5488836.1 UDP-4-amino-4,6-dideoxy-N-acetyl-beta-L-altrosamine transaminase [Candidatus Omnitrophota bacterium]
MGYIPYGRQDIDREDINAVIKVLEGDWITQGPAVERFEEALCAYTGAKHAVAVSNGTAALHIASLAAGISGGDEVITSPMTFVASANCVLYCGGRPVFVDIEKDTGNIDVRLIAASVTERTRAIIPVDYSGLPADMEGVRKIADERGLIVIEDAAHSLGASYKGGKVGSCRYSDMTIFSFHPVKPITTGEGGAVLTNDASLAHSLRMFRSHGITKDKAYFKPGRVRSAGEWMYQMQALGFNYRITDIQCALGVSQLGKLDVFTERRERIAAAYDGAFEKNPYFDPPPGRPDRRSARHLYPIRLKDAYKARREHIFARLRSSGIGVQVHYIPVYQHLYYEGLGYSAGLCPMAEDFYEREISLPLYPSMSAEDTAEVISVVLKVFREEG